MACYEIVRSDRRTVSLELTREGGVLVRAPQRMPTREIEAFVSAHADWIGKHKEKRAARAAEAGPVPDAAETAHLRALAKQVLPERTAYYAERMGLAPDSVRITSAKTRYGSCSGKNVICFSCYLMLSPPDAVDYVVVHEIAHIRHKNHGREFYALVASILPDYAARKRRLIPYYLCKSETEGEGSH